MPQKFVKVYTGSSLSVQALTNRLEENEIYPLIKDRAESALLAGFGASPNQQELFVPKNLEDQAKEIINALDF
jgi:hypothetical protein